MAATGAGPVPTEKIGRLGNRLSLHWRIERIHERARIVYELNVAFSPWWYGYSTVYDGQEHLFDDCTEAMFLLAYSKFLRPLSPTNKNSFWKADVRSAFQVQYPESPALLQLETAQFGRLCKKLVDKDAKMSGWKRVIVHVDNITEEANRVQQWTECKDAVEEYRDQLQANFNDSMWLAFATTSRRHVQNISAVSDPIPVSCY